MTDYGIQPTGYVRKSLAVHLAELEAAMVTEFGPGVIQTSQSPFGNLNGMMADLLDELEERNQELYQSYDPDQAEGVRLDTLGKMRLVARGNRSEEAYRQAITNDNRSRFDILDIEAALRGVAGVTYARMFTEGPDFTAGNVAVAVIGGDDEDVADAMRAYIVPGIGTYGNHRVTSLIGGRCVSFSIVRPIEVPVTLSIVVKARPGAAGCPPPSTLAIRDALVIAWMEERSNDMDVNHYTLRNIIERLFPSVELVSFVGERDEIVSPPNMEIAIGFIEIAQLSTDIVDVEFQ